jgi:hypothetical protein
MATTFNDDASFNGSVNLANATTVTLKSGSVSNGTIQASAGIDYDKLDQLIEIHVDFGFDSSTTPPTTKTFPIAMPCAAGVIRYVKAWMIDTGSGTAIAFDLHKAGVSALAATIDFTNTDANITPKVGTISSSALAAGTDYLEAVMTVSSGTNAHGPQMVIGYSYTATPS